MITEIITFGIQEKRSWRTTAAARRPGAPIWS
jgi:hypothetical protein